MKNHRLYSATFALVVIVWSLAGCLHYKPVDDCLLRAGFNAPTTVVAGPDGKATVLFTDSSEVFTDMEYAWDFRDGSSIDDGVNPEHTFQSPGSRRVLLTVRLGEGCVDTFSKLITVLDGEPMAKFVTDKAGNTCFTNETVTFTSNSTNASTLKWDFGDGSGNADNQAVVTHSYPVADAYTVRLIASKGGQNDTFTVVVTVKPHQFLLQRPEYGPAEKVIQLPDRSYALIGNNYVGTENKPYFMLVNEYGEITKYMLLTAVGSNAFVKDFARFPNGAFALVGDTYRKINNKTTVDIFYLWLDAQGNENSILATPSSMRSDALNELASSVITLSSGNGVVITGSVADPIAGTSHIFLFKSQPNLDNIDMNKTVALPNYEEGIGCVEVPGGFTVLGQSTPPSSSQTDIILFQVNAVGQMFGTVKPYGTSNPENAISIAKTADGTSLGVAGVTLNAGNIDFYWLKSDLDGTIIGSQKTYNDPQFVQDFSREINAFGNTGFLVSGIKNGFPCYFTIDASNTASSVHSFPNFSNGGFNSGFACSDGGFIFAGHSETSQLLLTKTDKNGKY